MQTGPAAHNAFSGTTEGAPSNGKQSNQHLSISTDNVNTRCLRTRQNYITEPMSALAKGDQGVVQGFSRPRWKAGSSAKCARGDRKGRALPRMRRKQRCSGQLSSAQVTLKPRSRRLIGQPQLPTLVEVASDLVRFSDVTALANNCGHGQVVTPALSNILRWQGASSQHLKLPALHVLAPTSCIIQSVST